MTIEEYVILWLSGRLPVRVSADVPSPMPAAFVTVEKTSASEVNRISSARIAVQCWAESRDAAAQLCAQVEQVMTGISAEPEISRCVLDTSYNFPDLERKRPRYQAVFALTHFLA